jgi:hypothetical protein
VRRAADEGGGIVVVVNVPKAAVGTPAFRISALGVRLRRLDVRGPQGRAEERHARAHELVGDPAGEGAFGTADGEVDAVLPGPRGECRRIGGVQRQGRGEAGGAAVAACDEELGAGASCAQLVEQRVLATAVADDEDLHDALR